VLTTDYKRLFVQGLKWDADQTGATLYNTLEVAARARLTQTSAGRSLIGTSANGHSVTYQLPQAGQGITQTAAAELCGEILRRYDEAKAALIADGTAEPTDDQIFRQLMSQLIAGYSSTTNFGALRFA
jgi:hypothetical protein